MSSSLFELRLYSDQNPLLAIETAEPLLAVLEAAGDLSPSTIAVKKGTRPYSRSEAKQELGRKSKEPKRDLYLGRDTGLMVHLSGWRRDDHPSSRVTLTVPFPWVADPEHGDERSRAIVSLAEALAAVYPPRFGWAHSREDAQLSRDPTFVDPFVPLQIHQIYWLNLFGPELIKKVGRERVLATPSERVAELPHGGALVLTRPAAGDLFSDEARQAQARALVHLRPELSYEKVLADLLARTAKLAPVERRWDPNLKHLFEKVVAYGPLSERKEREQGLNDLRAEVTEWRPASEALPSDVDDLDATLARYSVDGEKFALGMQSQVRGLEESPESLSDVDLHFYREDYPATRERKTVEELFIPTLGAWLGKLLVQNLDGRWVPRKNLDESQVIVGNRAWLPFLRVRRYLQSQRTVLEHSLLKFYREAERHASAARPPE